MRFTYILLFFVFCLCKANGEHRTLHSELNPGCKNKECTNSTLIHITSSNTNGTFHYLWSFVRSFTPAVFIFETDNQAQLTVAWDNITTKNEASFAFEHGKVFNSYAIELTNLYFVNATDNNKIYTVPLEEISWDPKNNSVPGAVLFTFMSTKTSPLNGTLSIAMSVFDQPGRSDSIPRLPYTESTSLFEVTLDDVKFKIANNKPAQAQLVSNLTFVLEGENVFTNLHESVSIDDEYTPGVFQRYVYSLTTNKREQSKGPAKNESAYVEWRPVAYIDTTKVIAKSIKVTNPTPEKDDLKRHSILNAYFKNKTFQANKLSNFKFGIPDDEFDYQKNRYLQFSISFGLNQVPEETLSMTLKIIIIAGLGIPMILFLIAIVYTIVRKLRSNTEFTSLSEETD